MANLQCPYFGECGGCSFQQLDYSVQLENKRKALASAINFKDIEVFSGDEYFYRTRMDFIFHSSGLGFRKKGRWQEIIDITECKISNKRLNELLLEVRDFFKNADYFDIKKHSGTFRYAVIRTPSNDSAISFNLNSDSTRIKEAVEKIKAFTENTSATNVMVSYTPANTDNSTSEDCFVVKGKGTVKETFLGKEFSYSIQGFFQNNHEMAEKMHKYVNEKLRNYELKYVSLLDLYAGVGTFGIINSELFKKVFIIESFAPCIETAKENILKNNVLNAEAIVLDAMRLKKLDLPSSLFVITDPPRSGMHQKTIDELNRLSPQVIVYISCNPQQLGKEIPKLKGYKIKSAALFDLFPQTPHSEAVIVLEK